MAKTRRTASKSRKPTPKPRRTAKAPRAENLFLALGGAAVGVALPPQGAAPAAATRIGAPRPTRSELLEGEFAEYDEMREAQRASFELKQLARCERAVKGGHLGALFEALHWCETGRVFPAWVSRATQDALADLVFGSQTARKRGRNATWWSQHRQDLIDLVRVDHVEGARELGLTWVDAFAFAEKCLRGSRSEGSSETMRKSYMRFRANSKQNPSRYYLERGSARFIDRLGGGPRRFDAGRRSLWAWVESRRGRAYKPRKW